MFVLVAAVTLRHICRRTWRTGSPRPRAAQTNSLSPVSSVPVRLSLEEQWRSAACGGVSLKVLGPQTPASGGGSPANSLQAAVLRAEAPPPSVDAALREQPASSATVLLCRWLCAESAVFLIM